MTDTTIHLHSPAHLPTDAAALPLLLNTAEAAAVLRLAPKTLRNWVVEWPEQHRGPEPVKVGGRRLYRRDDVLACAGLEAAA
ncbi:helix-turn-helix domain-containing protein [Microbacterium arthrosphaerae]|uniref:helix-turn-helix domain-containing protein n=1 Tax=Microbacterium arthrosphaerae TaxID=792652 RepID=UPI0035E52B3C